MPHKIPGTYTINIPGPHLFFHIFKYTGNIVGQPIGDLGEWAIASHGKGTHPYMKMANVDFDHCGTTTNKLSNDNI